MKKKITHARVSRQEPPGKHESINWIKEEAGPGMWATVATTLSQRWVKRIRSEGEGESGGRVNKLLQGQLTRTKKKNETPEIRMTKSLNCWLVELWEEGGG